MAAHSQCLSDIKIIAQYIESIQSNGRRLISEAEICLAILHRDTARFCDANRKLTNNTNDIVKNVFANATETTSHTTTKIDSLNLIIIPEPVDLSATEEPPNNDDLQSNGEAADLDKPTKSLELSTRRSSRSSSDATESEIGLNMSNTKMSIPAKKKYKHYTIIDQLDKSQNLAQSSIVGVEHSVPEKKQKTQDASPLSSRMASKSSSGD